jgi:hypothetical protein
MSIDNNNNATYSNTNLLLIAGDVHRAEKTGTANAQTSHGNGP